MSSHSPVLTICGGGNAGHALAVAASQHFDGEIRWLAGTPQKAQILRSGVFSPEGLVATGVMTGCADRISAISSDPADIIPGSHIVILAVPAFAHAPVLERIAPYLDDSALVGAFPARSGFEFEAAHILGVRRHGKRAIFALQTLPWSTRVQQPGRVTHVGAVKAEVLMAALPARRGPEIAAKLMRILGTRVVPTHSFLSMTLGNPGQIIHPGLMYGLFGNWSGRHYHRDEIPYFYRDTTDETGAFVEQLSADVRAVAVKIERAAGGELDLSGVLSIHDWLRLSYPTHTADAATVASCFRTGPLQARKAPMREIAPGRFMPDFSYRYMTEDVPYGLVVTKGIAEIAGTGTPAIDTILRWAQRRMRTRFLSGGRLDRKGVAALPVPQNSGIRTMDDLLAWYQPHRAIVGTIEEMPQAVAL